MGYVGGDACWNKVAEATRPTRNAREADTSLRGLDYIHRDLESLGTLPCGTLSVSADLRKHVSVATGELITVFVRMPELPAALVASA